MEPPPIGLRETLVGRMIRAAKLDVHLYEEVEADTSATMQAFMVVFLVSVAGGVGSLGTGAGPGGFGFGIVIGVASWAIWALLTFVIGTTIFRTPETHANWGQLARTTGFAQSPGVLRILLPIPYLGAIIFFAALLWQLVAMVIAVRQALDYTSTPRAIAVVVVGFVILVVAQVVLGLILFSNGTA